MAPTNRDVSHVCPRTGDGGGRGGEGGEEGGFTVPSSKRRRYLTRHPRLMRSATVTGDVVGRPRSVGGRRATVRAPEGRNMTIGLSVVNPMRRTNCGSMFNCSISHVKQM